MRFDPIEVSMGSWASPAFGLNFRSGIKPQRQALKLSPFCATVRGPSIGAWRMKTILCERLGIERPIVQAPMGGAVGPALAAAVCNAGGLGMLVLWRADADTMRRQIRETRALTSRPFGVNLNLDFPQEERLAVCLEERVPIISFFWRDPGSLVPRAKAGGAIVMHSVGSAIDAKRAVDCGVDIVIAQGWEAGGHEEAAIHPRYRELVLQANENDTVYLDNLFDVRWPNAPHRTLRNQTVRSWEAAGRPPSGDRPGEGDVIGNSHSIGPIVRYQSYTPGADAEGEIDAMSLWAGQSAGLVSKLQPAGDIVREIADEARLIFQRLSK